MRTVNGGNYSWARVGYARPLAPREEVPFAFVEDGTALVEVHRNDVRYTPAERAAGRARVTRVKFLGYPLRIEEDTTFVGTMFAQEHPHTPIFEVAPGARVVFRANPNCVNVTLPDSVRPEDFTGNNQQGTSVPTGNPEIPTVFQFCECSKCATFETAFEDAHRSGAWDAGATIIDLKASARLRREDHALVEADVAKQVAANVAALSRKQALCPSLAGKV